MSNRTKHFQNCLGVFQGGGVKAIAYAGAYEEAINRKVFFSELVGASAGSIIAVLIGAGAKPAELNAILERLETKKFLRQPVAIDGLKFNSLSKIWTPRCWKTISNLKIFSRYLGLHDGSYIREWINTELKTLLGITSTPKFSDLLIPTSVIATDLRDRKAVTWDSYSTPDNEVGLAVQASCLMPFFFQPIDKRYVDGGMLSNLPSFLLRPATIFDKILAFGFKEGETSAEFNDCEEYFLGLASTVVDGAVDIQQQLQYNVHTIRIDTLDVKSTDFKKIDKNLVDKLVTQGRQAAKDFFDNEDRLQIQNQKREDVAVDIFESFNLLLKSMYNNPQEILLSDDNPAWLYSLFPLLLKWKQDHVDVSVLLKKDGESQKHREYKIRLLTSLGFSVEEVESLPFRGFIIDGYLEKGSAIILSKEGQKNLHSTYLEGKFHFEVIRLLREKFKTVYSGKTSAAHGLSIQHTPEITSILKGVWQYADIDVSLSVEEIEIEKVFFLTKFVKGYKYRQIEELFKLYEQANQPLFEPIILKFQQDKYSYVTPPIIEVHNSEYFVIEGNARLLYAYKNGWTKLKVIVVTGVSKGLPSSGRYTIHQILISDKIKTGSNRYDNFERELFRKIEETIHDPSTSLK